MTIRATIARELAACARPLSWLAARATIPYGRLHEFMSGESPSMKTDKLERIMRVLQLELRRIEANGAKGGRPRKRKL